MLLERTSSVVDLAKIYSAADLFVNMTYEDTYPTVNLEARACGTPVATFQTGGSVEIVESSMIVKQGDIYCMKELVESQYADKRERKSE